MKRSLLYVIILIVVGIAVWYGYTEYNRTNSSVQDVKPVATVSVTALLAAFEKDSANAVKQYNDKIIVVSGLVKKIEAEGNPVVVSLGESGQLSSVQCSMDSTNAAGYKALKKGTSATLKGQVAGFRSDPLFGTDVILNRCVVINNP